MEDVEDPVFLNRPVGFLEKGIQLVMPALPTLLAGTAFHLESHVLPLVRANFRDHLEQLQVLHVIPCAFA